MDDEMARKGIKVDMTVHRFVGFFISFEKSAFSKVKMKLLIPCFTLISEEELEEWKRMGGKLSESWYDLSPIPEVLSSAK
jgi:hypothetical protein